MPAADQEALPVSDEQFADTVGEFSKLSHLALAVSGGADSTFLMCMFARQQGLHEKHGTHFPHLSVLTVDHGLRPASSDEVKIVVQKAKSLGLPVKALKWEHAGITSGVQDQARRARYRLMIEAVKEIGADALLTAHNLEDQVETMLMRMGRGSGIDGLSGMTRTIETDGIKIIRPMLGISRKQILATLKHLDETWIEDPSNQDDRFERVRIRELIGHLSAADIVPEKLALSIERLGRAKQALNYYTDQFIAKHVEQHTSGFCEINRDEFVNLPEDVAIRVVNSLLQKYGGGSDYSSLSSLEELFDWLNRAPYREDSENRTASGRTLSGCLLRLRKKSILIGRDPGRIDKAGEPISGQQTILWDRRFLVHIPKHLQHDELRIRPLAIAYEAKQEAHASADKESELLKRDPALPAFVQKALPGMFAGDKLLAVPTINDLDMGENAEATTARFQR